LSRQKSRPRLGGRLAVFHLRRHRRLLGRAQFLRLAAGFRAMVAPGCCGGGFLRAIFRTGPTSRLRKCDRMAETSPGVALTRALIQKPSVTPADAGALDIIEARLRAAGFSTHRLPFSEVGTPDIDNLYARIGDGAPYLLFAGHTDVVPPGDSAKWRADPFAGEIIGGELVGRG